MTRAVVLGDAVLDVVVRPSALPRAGADVPATIRLGAGGQGANLAVRLARRGVATELVCGLGTDPGAELVRHAIEPDGVRLRSVQVDGTGSVVILLDDAGERTMLSHRAPFAGAVDPAELPASDWTVVSGYLLLERGAERLAGALARRTGRRALVGCAVPEADVAAWTDAATALRPHLVILNRDEAAALDPTPSAPLVVVTDADGATATTAPHSVSLRAAPGPAALDTTGAGDAFAATLIAALDPDTWPPDRAAIVEALAAAVSLASAVAYEPGAQARVAGEAPSAGVRA
ncbi:MAG: carbohydrate kinase family protein [Candidatus Limnocylindria bacterium]